MFAIIETGGKQYQAEIDRYVDVELLDAKVDEKLTFDKVVAVVDGDGTKVGQPYVDGVVVSAKVLMHGKDKKVIVYKQRCKKGYRKKQGHRQNFTRVLVEGITGFAPKAKKAEVKEEKAVEVAEVKETAKKSTATKTAAKKTTSTKAAPKKTTKKEA